MPDIVKKYLEQIKEFWNKYNKKQKMIFFSSLSVIIIAMVILGLVLAQPQKVVVRYCTTAAEATEVRELLTSNNIPCTVGANFEIYIDSKDDIEAQLVLGSNNISSSGYSLSDALNGGFSQTADDKEKLYKDYLEKKFAEQLERLDAVKSAQVNIDFQDNGSTLFSEFREDQNAFINAIITTNGTIDEATAEAIALWLANNVGSKNTNNVMLMDSKGNLLYSGVTDATASGMSNREAKFERQLEINMETRVKEIILGTQMYSDAKIMADLVLNANAVTEVLEEYTIPEGSEQGLMSESYEVNSTGLTGAAGVAGTESNDDDTTTMLEDGTGTQQEYSLEQIKWLQNMKYTTTEKAKGTIEYDNSGLSAILIKLNVVTEEDLRTQGLLTEDMTYEEFKLANSDSTEYEVNENLARLISTGTGISEDDITLFAVQKYVFLETEETPTPVSFIIQIVLAVLIVALLLFVVFRSARPVTVSETEPELSVEDMLASTREQQAPLEEIDLQDKSEARKAIEKFVQENPEAVALLLRNWLNEGWD